MWPFAKKKQPTIVENIGPDAPKIKIAAEILSYSMVDGKLKMSFSIGDSIHSAEVPASVPRHYPLGTSIRLVVETT